MKINLRPIVLVQGVVYILLSGVFTGCNTKNQPQELQQIRTDSLTNLQDEVNLPDTLSTDTVEIEVPKGVKFVPPVIYIEDEPEYEPVPFCPPVIVVEEDEKDKVPDEDLICNITEIMPSFPGGNEAMFKYISENLKYPDTEACIQGRVVLRFMVNKEGHIEDVNVLRSLDDRFDKEAIRVVKSMPQWTPGKQNGKEVNVYFNLPITFRYATATN